jgi:phosphoribosylanthranilate isomerase
MSSRIIKLKVCGMKYKENIQELVAISPDYIGFIFYPKSKRYVGDQLDVDYVNKIPNTITKVGVFVNATTDEIVKTAEKYGIEFIQLHGDEGVEQCKELKFHGFHVIKAFSIDQHFDFDALSKYKLYTDYYLFDTKGESQGGNGYAFDWSVLDHYNNEKPFFLSGGVGTDNIEGIEALKHLDIHAVDVNSKFEKSPGLKDVKLLREFEAKLRDKTLVKKV